MSSERSTTLGADVPPAPPKSSARSTAVPSVSVRADNANVEHECMTACELASWLRVNRKTVYEYAARNVIPCRRLGRRLVFSRPAVAAWLARSSTADASTAFAIGRR
jgi:excisionase family DNA binding protein